jgi:amino acid transporter
VWWQLDNPLLAVIVATSVDVVGYIPTFRKSFYDPWSETLIFWVAVVFSGIFTILAMREYNFITMVYTTSVTLVNLILSVFVFLRRFYVPKPEVFINS